MTKSYLAKNHFYLTQHEREHASHRRPLSRERDFGICLFFTSFARLGISEVSYSTLLLLLVFIISYKLSPSGSQMQY